MLQGVDDIAVSASIGAMIVGTATALGADRGELTRRTGFDPESARDPDARIPLALESALWSEGARLVADDAFGIHAAELVKPGAFDVFDYAVRTAPTFRTAIERLARYNRLVHDAAVFTLHDEPQKLRVEHGFHNCPTAPCRHAAEFTLACLVVVGTELLERPLRPLLVEFAHAEPSAAVLAEHRRVFGVDPRFSQPANALEFEHEILDRPLPRADQALSRVIERYAESLFAALPQASETTCDRVRHLLSRTLGEGTPRLAEIAARLRMAQRTLQRKLADEGQTFEALLDDVRRTLALRYLADRKLAVAEVAYLLGYSEPSPFHRAFKRWTGKTPSEARGHAA
jgi:AraC-like DNA-binding protein